MSAAQQLLNSQVTRDDEIEESLWTKFTQQRLKAWQISLPPHCAIALYLLGGVAFMVLGFSLLLISWSVEEHTLDYTDFSSDDLLSGRLNAMEIEVTKDMTPPIWVYYELEGFHQNHRRYVKSRDNRQLEASEPISVEARDLRACSPAVMGDAGRPLYPCGLVAHSVFNDSFAFVKQDPGEGNRWTMLDVDSSARTIAWPADVDGGKFANYNPEAKHPSGPKNQELLDMWLIRRFPPVACVQTSMAPSMRYKPLYVGTRDAKVPAAGKGAGLRTVTVADCKGYFTDHPKCNFADIDGNSVPCSGPEYKEVAVPDWGVASGHFMAWMRIAGLPNFRKLWGKIDEPLVKGTRLKVYVASHFVVKPFEGRKAVVISTSSSLGGRNDFLGKGYLLVGLCCLLFGAWFLWNHLSPASS